MRAPGMTALAFSTACLIPTSSSLVALEYLKTTVKVPSVFSPNLSPKILLAFSDWLPGTFSEVVKY